MSELTPFSIVIPWPGKPKARPRVTENGTYMPKKYMEWRNNVTEYLTYHPGMIEGPVALEIEFDSLNMSIRVIPVVDDYQRANGVTGDIDNLIGGLMDAMQEAQTFLNDAQVVSVKAKISNRKGRT